MKPESLIAQAKKLHAPSPTVVRLLNLLNNHYVDYDEVVNAVTRDAVLSAKLLAQCNSGAYGLAQPVASLEQGVLFLGSTEIHRLVMVVSFGGQIATGLPGYDMATNELWRHSLVAAMLTPQTLARSGCFGIETSIGYTAGLLHDIGKLVIGQTVDQALREQVHQIVSEGKASLIEAEQSVFGCDHAQIGACLLRQWRIPEIIVEAVARHHRPPPDGREQLATHVHVADAIAHHAGASPGWENSAVVIHETALTSLNFLTVDVETLTDAALDSQEAVARQEDRTIGARRPAPVQPVGS